MKRPKYHVTIDGKPVATKYAWNSALRAIPKAIREIMPNGTAWELSRHCEKSDPWHYKSGDFTWKDSAGNTYAVAIRREDPPES